jgi:hypothetical protein
MNPAVSKYMASIGRRGGLASRRKLEPESARAMVLVREAKRAYKNYYTHCFWSCDPDLKIKAQDVPWVAEQLMKHGGRAAWEQGARLCR